MGKKSNAGITASRDDDFSEWYTQVITKAELFDYSLVSGCFVLRPSGYALWEAVQMWLDCRFKEDGVKNASFPLFIPESLLTKEAEHVEGFTPEVAWVTHSGETELNERLAVRPTSETIMYDSYAKWIRSYKDLPLRINQWANVVRWEFKHPVPFLRSREFLWQEGHTAFARKKEAEDEARRMLDIYADVYESLLAVPVIKGRKSDKEKFAGAEYSLSCETFLPNGKAIQGCTSHHLGQNFAHAFDITFTDKDQQKKHVWQNSWGFTTRSIGVLVMMHSDDRGLVLPPRIASTQAVIVPILFDATRKKVLKKAEDIKKKLEKKGITVLLDDRSEYSPGWKFNEWELKGIPLRLELGPKDLENDSVMVVRRDTGKKISVAIKDVDKECSAMLEKMQKDLLAKARKRIKAETVEVKNWKEFAKAIKDKKLVYAPWCEDTKCEDQIKDKTEGAKSLVKPFKVKEGHGTCAHCSKAASTMMYFGKSY